MFWLLEFYLPTVVDGANSTLLLVARVVALVSFIALAALLTWLSFLPLPYQLILSGKQVTYEARGGVGYRRWKVTLDNASVVCDGQISERYGRISLDHQLPGRPTAVLVPIQSYWAIERMLRSSSERQA